MARKVLDERTGCQRDPNTVGERSEVESAMSARPLRGDLNPGRLYQQPKDLFVGEVLINRLGRNEVADMGLAEQESQLRYRWHGNVALDA